MQHQLKIQVDLGVRRQERKIDFTDAAIGREKPVKPRPVDSILGLHRARC